jgi:hypothetical protein
LIKSIYGDIEKLEKYEEEEVARLNTAMINRDAESRKRGLQQAVQKVRNLV